MALDPGFVKAHKRSFRPPLGAVLIIAPCQPDIPLSSHRVPTQEAYYASLQLFLTPNVLYLLVVDMASAVDNVAENAQNPLGELGVLRWVRSLTYRVPRAAVVLVGTKCDLVTDFPPLSPLKRLEAAAATVETKISCYISSWAKQNSSPQIRLEDGMRLVRFDESTGSPQVDNGKGWPCDVKLGRILHDSSGNKRVVSMRLPLSGTML